MFRMIAAIAAGAALASAPLAASASPPDGGADAGAAGMAGVMPADQARSYQLGTGDQLHIVVFDEPQLTGDFYVGSDGRLSLLWVGPVPARGRTVDQVRADIEARLKDGYILDPKVSVQVVAYRPFYILGEVNKPGQYPYVNGMTVMSAVATAGGFTYRADTGKAYVKHLGENDEVKEKLSASTEVRAGDTIRIGESLF